jgi:anti-sigma factor RsiW
MTEVVTNYLDDALPPDEHQRFERHLSYCAGCGT